MERWQSSRLDQLVAVVTSVHAGGRGRVVAHRLQSLFKAHPRARQWPRKGGSNKAHSHQPGQSTMAGRLSFPVVRTKSKSRIWLASYGMFKLYWIMKIMITQRDALHLLLMCIKTTILTLQLSRSQGSLEKVHFGKRKENTHYSGLAGLKMNEGVWSLLCNQELPHSKVTNSACCHKWPNPTLCIPLQGKCHLTIVNIYAPTLTNPSEVKEAFYSELKTTISSITTWWCQETSMLDLTGSAQCGLVWLDIKGSATVAAIDYCSSEYAQNSNCASPKQCSDC